MTIRSRAPLRISFAGGGTDVPPFPASEGGAVLSATINRYAYGSLTPRADDRIEIESVDFKQKLGLRLGSDFPFDGNLDLIKAAIKRIGSDSLHGYDLVLRSNAPPGSGLGSSSTMMVALVGLLHDHLRMSLTDYQAAHLAWEIERLDLGIAGGLQDHYAATFGGFNYMEFGETVEVTPLRVRDDVQHELEASLLLCYTGKTRASGLIIDDQTSRMVNSESSTLEGLRAQKVLAGQMKSTLLRGDLQEFGVMLGEAWMQKKKMSPMITNPLIDEAFEVALREGALGGKVTGAGGGGYILFFCEFTKRHQVAAALEHMDLPVTEFCFERGGITTWRV